MEKHYQMDIVVNEIIVELNLQGERYAYDEDTNECILLDKNMEPFYV